MTAIQTAYEQKITVGKEPANLARRSGWIAIAGALLMVIGAILYFSTGTDLWAAVDQGVMEAYLPAAGAFKGRLVANLSFWILGVIFLGVSLTLMARLNETRPVMARTATLLIRTAVPLAIISFIAMMAIVVKIAPDNSPSAVALAEVIGWIGIRADDLATALIVGFAPLFTSLAARGGWMPVWLVRSGYLAGAVGALSLLVLFIPPLAGLGFLIVPVGLGWMLAAGIVLIRRA